MNSNSYRYPILVSLFNNEGKAETDIVLRDVFDYVKNDLTYDDTTIICGKARSEVAWRNRSRFTVAALKREGLVSSPKVGTWELTPNGVKTLKTIGII